MKKLGLKKKVTATKKVWVGKFLGWDKKKKVAVTFFFYSSFGCCEALEYCFWSVIFFSYRHNFFKKIISE